MVLGYGINPGGDVYLVYSLNITGSGTLYARIWDWYSLSNFVLGETKKVSVDDSNENAYYPVEFQDTIESSVRTDYTEYIERAFNNVPALKTLYGKMRFSNYTTYNAYPSHDGSAGVTYPYFGVFAPVDILSPYDDAADGYIKHAIIHELGHALDGAFYERTGTFLHDYSEFTTARSELLAIRNAQDDSTANADRPLSEYAFSDDEGFEFLAEAFIAYYRDRYGAYYSTTLGYTTDSLNSAFRKYLCYAENDYNMESDCE